MSHCSAIVILFSLCCLSTSNFAPAPRETPRSLDPRLEVILFAQEPQIVHPVAVAFDSKGRLLVVESHTHFRPATYQGPTHDRIQMLEDTDGDGRADRISTFFEGTKATMDIALAPDGSIYLATRNEILRLRDTKGTNQADERTRIVYLDTKGDYPHNGLSGLAFDQQGNLIFGMGENLGAGYTLIGSDGIKHKGGGEGGNIFRCTADGKNLKRIATGFWNPFGIHVDRFGRMIAVDNDPDASPPCRMLHIVEGGDYGYQFRYGRSGRHPFQSWNGQLAGTLPMICGTGEAPCEVLRYETNGLPTEYYGKYFVTSWADHRVEMYDLRPHGVSYEAKQQILVQGGKDFRPCGMAVAPDGSLFISDWVLPDYNLHGKGTIWQVRLKKPFERFNLAEWRASEQQEHSRTRQMIEALSTTTPEETKRTLRNPQLPLEVRAEGIPLLLNLDDVPTLLNMLLVEDAFVRQRVVRHLAKQPRLLAEASKSFSSLPLESQLSLLLAQRERGDEYMSTIDEKLRSPHEEVQFLTVKWIADLELKQFRREVEAGLKKTSLAPRMTLAYATALARLDGQEVNEARLADQFVAILNDTRLSPEQQQQFLKLIPVTHPKLTVKLLEQLYSSSQNNRLREDVVLSLVLHPHSDRIPALQRMQNIARDANITELIKLGLPAVVQAKRDFSQERPPAVQVDEWLQRYSTGGHREQGLRVFYHPQGPGCYRCHAINGRGDDIGPDLSIIGRNEPIRLMESLLQPSATVAPHYQAYTLVMHDGRTLNGILVKTYYDVYTYLSPEGKLFEVKSTEVAETALSAKSLMPEGLLNQLSDQEVKDLLAYLMSCK